MRTRDGGWSTVPSSFGEMLHRSPQPVLPDPIERRLDRLRRLARLYDAGIRIPGTRFTIGLDPLIGLLPGLGDLIGAGVALWVVLEAADLGASGFVLLRMLLNVAIDTVGGTLPVAGDVFDVLWRANLKNVRLLERHLAATGAIDKPSTDL